MACNPSLCNVLANKRKEWGKYVVCGFDLFLCCFIVEMQLRAGRGLVALRRQGEMGLGLADDGVNFGGVCVVDGRGTKPYYWKMSASIENEEKWQQTRPTPPSTPNQHPPSLQPTPTALLKMPKMTKKKEKRGSMCAIIYYY